MDIETPVYVLNKEKLKKNLEILKLVQEESGAKILLALKGFAFRASFDLIRDYLHGCCASGLYEAMLAKEVGREIHTYSPAFKDSEIDEIVLLSDHIVFNSFNQWSKYKSRVIKKLSCGIRINPETSSAPKEIYNPCALFSRLGVTKKEFRDDMLDGIEGFHFHALCEQNVDALENVLKDFESNFSSYFKNLKWINFGGGHLVTKDDYDINRLIKIIKDFKDRYSVDIYLELGEAVGWQTGYLMATVIDIVHNKMNIAILDTSAEAHMPDTIIMPYRAEVRGAGKAGEKKFTYRLAGNSCLAGDIMGDYSFDQPLHIGDRIIFEDQIHYTIVKNTTFNGIKLPDLAIEDDKGKISIVKKFGYEEYKRRN